MFYTNNTIKFGTLIMIKRSSQKVTAVIRFLIIDLTTNPLSYIKLLLSQLIVKSVAGFFIVCILVIATLYWVTRLDATNRSRQEINKVLKPRSVIMATIQRIFKVTANAGDNMRMNIITKCILVLFRFINDMGKMTISHGWQSFA